MIDVSIIAVNPMSLHIREWDVRTITGTYLGVIEEFEAGYMYTDSFGYLQTFFDGEGLAEIQYWVENSFNNTTLH